MNNIEQSYYFELKGLEDMLRSVNSGADVHKRDNLRMRIMGMIFQYTRKGYFKSLEKVAELISDAKDLVRKYTNKASY